MRFTDRFGVHSNGNADFWGGLFTFQTLIFLAVLLLLIWGLYSYFKNSKNESKADKRFEKDVTDLQKLDRETVQAYLRQKELDHTYQDDYPIDNSTDYKPKNK
jgi:hypothetical protein